MAVTTRGGAGPRYPGEKSFAFTVLDDTDDGTVENLRPLYDLLHELGFRTTKSVWPVECPEGSDLFFAGATLADAEYRAFCLDLQERGFEVTWHCATMESSDRARTERGLATFREIFGDYPRLHANHGRNRENLYWGHKRYRTRLIRGLSRVLRPRADGGDRFEGEEEGSPFFWGDLCGTYIRFVRNFTFNDINTTRADPHTPYRLRQTPYVPYWFSTSDAPDVDAFLRLITRDNVDRLAAAGGVCILSTHLGKGFVRDGRVNERVAERLRYLASLPGWFAPVSEILEHRLAERPNGSFLPPAALARLELLHAFDRMRGHISVRVNALAAERGSADRDRVPVCQP